MNLAATRKAIATELTAALPGVTIHTFQPRPVRVRDGWLVLTRVEPSTFGTCMATFDVLVTVGSDDLAAEQALDALSVALVDAIGGRVGTPVAVTPQSLVIGGSELFCATATLLCEVDTP